MGRRYPNVNEAVFLPALVNTNKTTWACRGMNMITCLGDQDKRFGLVLGLVLKLTFRQYPAIHTNYCTPFQTFLKLERFKSIYSRTCLGRPPLLPSKSGLSRQVVSHIAGRTKRMFHCSVAYMFTDSQA